jgi:aspartate-semialdehyde dehydrogenase
MVGQRFVSLLEQHSQFEVVAVAATKSSAGRTYEEAVAGRWVMGKRPPLPVRDLTVLDAWSNRERIRNEVDFVFCAIAADDGSAAELETAYAKSELPVVSNTKAHRWTKDVPIVIPEVNPEHIRIIDAQRRRLGTRHGFIVAKPSCSVQSYVPAIHALRHLEPTEVRVVLLVAVSGSGQPPLPPTNNEMYTFSCWPDFVDNAIPLAREEEEKGEREPLKIWGSIDLSKGTIEEAPLPTISAQFIRVPVTDGHTAAVFLSLSREPTLEEILASWREFPTRPIPSGQRPLLTYRDDGPQAKRDRDAANGMGITIGRLCRDNLLGYRFLALSHNMVRGAAGSAILMAELLRAEGYIQAK